MAESTILAYFQTEEAAKSAETKLHALRAIDTAVDRISRLPGDGVDRVMNPITGDFSGIGYLTQNADFTNKSAATLAAADVIASGQSDGGQDAITGRNILLTVVIDEANREQALQVIKEAGGMI